jgi:hypothetical protein
VKQSFEPGAMSALFPAKAFQTGLPFYIIVFTMTNETHDTDDKTRLISLPEAAELYGFNAVYLRNLARKRRLKAEKVGNTWITTPNDMEDYIRSRQVRGVYRDDIQPLD